MTGVQTCALPIFTITNGAGSIDLSAAAGGAVNQSNIVYVGKHGNDGNSGLNIDEAKLTFGAAITTASGIGTATVVCMDSGTYTENLTGQSNVNIYAPNAYINGNHTLVDGNVWTFDKAAVASGVNFTLSTNATASIYLNTLLLIGGSTGFLASDSNAWLRIYVSRVTSYLNSYLTGVAGIGMYAIDFQDIIILQEIGRASCRERV